MKTFLRVTMAALLLLWLGGQLFLGVMALGGPAPGEANGLGALMAWSVIGVVLGLCANALR